MGKKIDPKDLVLPDNYGSDDQVAAVPFESIDEDVLQAMRLYRANILVMKKGSAITDRNSGFWLQPNRGLTNVADEAAVFGFGEAYEFLLGTHDYQDPDYDLYVVLRPKEAEPSPIIVADLVNYLLQMPQDAIVRLYDPEHGQDRSNLRWLHLNVEDKEEEQYLAGEWDSLEPGNTFLVIGRQTHGDY